MGEAKRKREEFRALALAQLERWDFPATPEEASAVAEIGKLPVLRVTRYPSEALKWMKMPANQCHTNARWMEKNDPEAKCRQVSGWWPQQGNYVHHSVVERDGELFCVTPAPTHPGDEFDFIPDADIEWREEDDFRVAYRKGLKIGPGLRSDPVENTRIANIVRKRILSGMDPWQAGSPPFE